MCILCASCCRNLYIPDGFICHSSSFSKCIYYLRFFTSNRCWSRINTIYKQIRCIISLIITTISQVISYCFKNIYNIINTILLSKSRWVIIWCILILHSSCSKITNKEFILFNQICCIGKFIISSNSNRWSHSQRNW